METVFFEISLVLVAATVAATVAKFLRQPTIPAYILAGVVLGPAVLKVIQHGTLLETLSTFGIAFLLFLVGIELDLRRLLKLGKIAAFLGVAQMVFAVGVGYLIITLLGFSHGEAFFLSIALGFSSTIIAVKLLSERRELDSLYGQIVVGVMLVQDFIAILFLIFFQVFDGSSGGPALAQEILLTLVKGGALLAVALLASRYLLAHLFRYFAHSTELLFLGAISWALVFAIFAIFLGFSVEVGALIAGVSLSFLPYSLEISRRITSLRDFFLPIFFAVLGGQLVFGQAGAFWLPAVILSLFVLLVSPLLVTGLMLWRGYRARTSFQAGMIIGQISEFSFIVVGLGFSTGVIGQNIVSLVALIGLITMTLSTYMVEYFEPIYQFVRPLLKRLERKKLVVGEQGIIEQMKDHVVIFGYHTMGRRAREIVQRLNKPVLVVDHNPDVIEQLAKEGVPHLYGNLNDTEILEAARIGDAAYVISTVPNAVVVRGLLDYLKNNRVAAKTIVTAFHVEDALDFYERGASFVLYPTLVSAHFLEHLIDRDIKQQRLTHISELQTLNDAEHSGTL